MQIYTLNRGLPKYCPRAGVSALHPKRPTVSPEAVEERLDTKNSKPSLAQPLVLHSRLPTSESRHTAMMAEILRGKCRVWNQVGERRWIILVSKGAKGDVDVE